MGHLALIADALLASGLILIILGLGEPALQSVQIPLTILGIIFLLGNLLIDFLSGCYYFVRHLHMMPLDTKTEMIKPKR